MPPALPHLRLSRPLAVLDVEATGLSPGTARVVEVAAVRLDPTDRPKLFRTRVNPGCPIPPATTAVHRITDADVRHAPPFAAVARPLADLLVGCDLAGFNLAAYDLPLLAHEFARAGVPFPLAGRAVVDVFRLFARQEPRDLAAAVRLYLGRDHTGAHSAAADAWATAEVLDRQLARYPDLPPDPAGLHRLLVEVDVGGRYFRLLALYTATLPCRCGLGAGGVAAVRRFCRPTLLEEWGPLDPDGGWATAEVEADGPGEEEQLATEVSCPGCVTAADRADWDVRAGGVVEDRLGQTPFWACLSCGAEHLIV